MGSLLEDRGLNCLAQVRRHAEFEDLPVAIAPDVHGVVHWVNPRAVSHLPARSDFTHLQARAHRGELALNVFRIHKFYFEDRHASGVTRSSASVPVGFE